MAVGDKIFVADKDTLDEVNTKCGTILTNTNNLNIRLTATRAGYLDYLANSTYGLNAIKNAINTVDNNVDSIKTYTTTNNTGSKTGVLSQKSSYIINMLENTTYGLNAIKTGINNMAPIKLTSFKISVSGRASTSSGGTTIYTFNKRGFTTYIYGAGSDFDSTDNAAIWIADLFIVNCYDDSPNAIATNNCIPFNSGDTIDLRANRGGGYMTVDVAGFYIE